MSDSTFEYTTRVLPRDLEPGDKIDRINKDLDFVTATVKEVVKVRKMERTHYRVYLVEYDELPDNRKPWAENKHLAPFILQPTQKVQVTRTANAEGLI
jgi:hypothetical protein